MKIIKGFVIREVGGKQIAVATGEASRVFNGMITLNDSARVIWDALSAGTDMDGIIRALTETYDVSESQAKTDAEAFVEKLRAVGIIEE